MFIKNLGVFKVNLLLIVSFFLIVWLFAIIFSGRTNAYEYQIVGYENKFSNKFEMSSFTVFFELGEEENWERKENLSSLEFGIIDEVEIIFEDVIEEKVEEEIVTSPLPDFEMPENLDSLFDKYGSEYGVLADSLKRIAKCESGFNNMARNGLYGGMFQFSPATWISNRKLMGLNSDINLRFNAEEAIRTAAFKISRDGMGAWPVCSE